MDVPKTITREQVVQALEILGLDPIMCVGLYLEPEHVVIDWHEDKEDPNRPGYLLAQRNVIHITD